METVISCETSDQNRCTRRCKKSKTPLYFEHNLSGILKKIKIFEIRRNFWFFFLFKEEIWFVLLMTNLLQPTGHVMHQQFNVQQLYVLPTLYLCVL